MRTDLVGGTDRVASIAALQEKAQDAHVARDAAQEAVKHARGADIAAGAEHLRNPNGDKPPALTEPKLQKRLDDTEREFAILALALRQEQEALTADIVSRSDDITADLAAKEDAGDIAIAEHLDAVTALLEEKAELRSHGDHVRAGATGNVGKRKVTAESELRTLRVAVAMSDTASSREELLRNYDAWTDLVDRATRTVRHEDRIPDRDPLTGDMTVPACDEAIEAEVERLTEAGEPVPTPTSIKWVKKLGTSVKPKGQGTGFAKEVRQVPVVMPPDLDSADARHKDLVPS